MSDSSSEEEPLARRAARLPSQELLNADSEDSDSDNEDRGADDDGEEQEGTVRKPLEVAPVTRRPLSQPA